MFTSKQTTVADNTTNRDATPVRLHLMLVRKNDYDVLLANPIEDVRGHTVLDQNGSELGTVDGLFVDEREKHVRLLLIKKTGGFLRFAATMFLLPVDDISQATTDTVRVNRTREWPTGVPHYDPRMVPTLTITTN